MYYDTIQQYTDNWCPKAAEEKDFYWKTQENKTFLTFFRIKNLLGRKIHNKIRHSQWIWTTQKSCI